MRRGIVVQAIAVSLFPIPFYLKLMGIDIPGIVIILLIFGAIAVSALLDDEDVAPKVEK